MIGRTAMTVRWCGSLLISIAFLAGCTTGRDGVISRVDLEQRKSAYTGEAYEVLIVNRSKFDRRFWPAIVKPPFEAAQGTIIVDTNERVLYFYQTDGTARRYGIAVGASGYAWSGQAVIERKAMWPAWYPTDDMRQKSPGIPKRIEPGTHNPLGARALYLYKNGRDTLYRIHGTSEPWTIGTTASSGCIRMLNEDIIDLFDRVQNGANVVVR